MKVVANPIQIVTGATSSTLVLTSNVYAREIASCTCVETANQLSDCIVYTTQLTTVVTVNCSKCCNAYTLYTRAKTVYCEHAQAMVMLVQFPTTK